MDQNKGLTLEHDLIHNVTDKIQPIFSLLGLKRTKNQGSCFGGLMFVVGAEVILPLKIEGSLILFLSPEQIKGLGAPFT